MSIWIGQFPPVEKRDRKPKQVRYEGNKENNGEKRRQKKPEGGGRWVRREREQKTKMGMGTVMLGNDKDYQNI